MRHGQAENNVKKILVGRHLESHLTAEGRMQAHDTAQYLKKLSISKIYTSPVTRTIETARIVSEVLNLVYEIEERLYEIELGRLAGSDYDEILNKYGNLFLSFSKIQGNCEVVNIAEAEPILKRPYSAPAISEISAKAVSCSRKIRRARSNNLSPASVKITRRGVRVKSGTPTSSSS